MKRPFLSIIKIAEFVLLWLACRNFSYCLTQPLQNSAANIFIAFLAVGILHLAILQTCTGRKSMDGIKYWLHVWCLFAIIIAIRAVGTLYNVDASATMTEAVGYILQSIPLTFLFHGVLQVTYLCVHRYLKQNGKGRFTQVGKGTVQPS